MILLRQEKKRLVLLLFFVEERNEQDSFGDTVKINCTVPIERVSIFRLVSITPLGGYERKKKKKGFDGASAFCIVPGTVVRVLVPLYIQGTAVCVRIKIKFRCGRSHHEDSSLFELIASFAFALLRLFRQHHDPQCRLLLMQLIWDL